MLRLPSILLSCVLAVSAQGPTSVETRRASWDRHQRMAGSSPFRELAWRAIGPEFQGGRVEAIAWPEGEPDTIYLGVGSGGVFGTTDGGATWTALFDDQPTTSIGSIAVAPGEPGTVWVGTGETHPGTAFPGFGIYRSDDGGATWTCMGLEDSQHIARVVVDPQDPDVVHAAVLGHHGSRNDERGVFRTTDGGKTWARVLFVDDSVGAVDLVMDAADHRTLYAAMWARRGDGSGIHKTTDGGESWTRLGEGLPATEALGRTAVDVSRSDPDVVYVLAVNRELARGRRPGGAEVYRSDDGGATFRRTHEDPLPTWVGWDFCDVRIAPEDPDRIYVCGQVLLVSADGGRTFAEPGEAMTRLHPHPDFEGRTTKIHLDMHEVVLDPERPGRVLIGTDGGLYVSTDHARSWLHVNNLPIGEFYTVHVDQVHVDQGGVPGEAYRIWGGTQDNASLYGPSDHVAGGGGPDPWKHVFLDRWGGGDGFVTLPDPTEPGVVYFEHQNGDMRRKRLDGPLLSGRGDVRIRPRAAPGEPKLDFAWNTPLLVSAHEPATLYCAAQRVFRSPDRGDSWRAISPDLGRGALVALAESPRRRGLLYAASGPGSVHVTRDDGATWERTGEGLPRRTVTHLVASAHADGTAWVSLSGAGRDEFAPHVYRTDDFGGSWRRIDGGLPQAEPVYALVEDPVHRDVVYAGTMLGVYVTLDGGASWCSLGRGLPAVPVFDLAVQARAQELVAATHGRSMFVVDVAAVHEAAAARGRGDAAGEEPGPHPVPDDPRWLTYEASAGPGGGRHVVLVAADQEYRSEQAMPMLARILAERHGFHCTVLFAVNEDGLVDPTLPIRWQDEEIVHDIPGLEHLRTADLLILFSRLITLPEEQVRHLVDYVDSGRPVFGIRTANHGFLGFPYELDGKRVRFGEDVLGGSFREHHGGWHREATRGTPVPGQRDHPILTGVDSVWGPSDVYRTYPEGGSLPEGCTPLLLGQPLTGRGRDDPPNEKKEALPIAWTKTWTGSTGEAARVFHVTMGSARDFQDAGLRRLAVNAVYWCVGLEDRIVPDSSVEPVGPYEPLESGFAYEKLGVRPRPVSDFRSP